MALNGFQIFFIFTAHIEDIQVAHIMLYLTCIQEVVHRQGRIHAAGKCSYQNTQSISGPDPVFRKLETLGREPAGPHI